jgi:hypothetical protein
MCAGINRNVYNENRTTYNTSVDGKPTAANIIAYSLKKAGAQGLSAYSLAQAVESIGNRVFVAEPTVRRAIGDLRALGYGITTRNNRYIWN